MTDDRRIEREVAKNRRDKRRLESYRVEVDQEPSQSFSFDGSVIEVNASAEVYTRPINDSLVFGHPEPDNGFGRGAVGDHRGDWSLQGSVQSDDGEFTKLGRETVADSLEGVAGGIESVVVGSGSGAATTNDSSLESEAGSDGAWSDGQDHNETRSVGAFRFSETPNTVSEVGVEDGDGDLMCRLVSSGVGSNNDEEMRIEITLEFVGDGVADAVITDGGEEAVAESVRSMGTTVGIDEMAIGTGTADASESDTELESEAGRKNVGIQRSNQRVRAYTRWLATEPAGQPYDIAEMGLFDNNGRLVMRAVFGAWTKDSEYQPFTGASLRII